MANFLPFKIYILSVLDEFILRHNIQEPFLDFGCGKGDVSFHLASQGWKGTAVDIAPQAVEVSRKLLTPYPQVEVMQGTIDQLGGGRYGLVLILDVLEHLSDDGEVLSAAARVQSPGAHLVVTVPSNPAREWRWDDEVYGHLRRYRPKDFELLLHSHGYSVVELWDISFPFFWLLRRGFTWIKKPPPLKGSALKRTKESPFTNAWQMGKLSDFLSNPTLWKPVFRLQRKNHQRVERGHEIMVLARRDSFETNSI